MLARLVPLHTWGLWACSRWATPQGRERPGRLGGLGFPGALAAGSPGLRGVGRPLWPGFWVCGQPGWPPPSGLDVFLGDLGALDLRAGSALASSVSPPREGEADTRVMRAPRVQRGSQGRLSFKGVDCRSWGLPTLEALERLWVLRLLAASRRLCCPPLTFVNKAHPLPGLACAPCPCPELPPPVR